MSLQYKGSMLVAEPPFILLPDDVIYYVIFPYLIPNISCNLSIQQSKRLELLSSLNHKSYQYISKLTPSCINISKVNIGKRYWCQQHHPTEYIICSHLIDIINSDQAWPFPDESVLINRESNATIVPSMSYHISVHKLLTVHNLVSTVEKILEGSPYGVSHTCCRGTGVMFGRIVDSTLETS